MFLLELLCNSGCGSNTTQNKSDLKVVWIMIFLPENWDLSPPKLATLLSTRSHVTTRRWWSSGLNPLKMCFDFRCERGIARVITTRIFFCLQHLWQGGRLISVPTRPTRGESMRCPVTIASRVDWKAVSSEEKWARVASLVRWETAQMDDVCLATKQEFLFRANT